MTILLGMSRYRLLAALAGRFESSDEFVRKTAKRHIVWVSLDEPLNKLAQIFAEIGDAVLAMKIKKLVRLLTKIDLIICFVRSRS